MNLSFSRLKFGGIAVAVIMLLTAAVPPLSLVWVTEVRDASLRVEDRLQALRQVQELLIDAETGQRGYVITGIEEFLQPYHAAIATLPSALDQLPARFTDPSAREQELLRSLLSNARERLAGLTQNVQLRRTSGFAAVQTIISTAEGKHHSDAVRVAVAELSGLQEALRATLAEDLQSKIRSAILFSLVSTLISAALLLYLARLMARAVGREERLAAQALGTSEALEHGMQALRRRNDEISDLGEMSRVLQTEMPMAEALDICRVFCERLLPTASGALYLGDGGDGPLERRASWGEDAPATASFEPGDCWGLRRRQTHQQSADSALRCAHCGTAHSGWLDVCLPLIAHGGELGLMHLRLDEQAADREALLSLAQTICEQVALSLSNAKLRHELREQSLRDPLTGLHNRRFMEEMLRKELQRAARNQTTVSLVMVDLDNFKQINDRHGHAAGDAVLRAAGKLLARSLRSSDAACRFGGEEFVLILPNCAKAQAAQKADQIREALLALVITDSGKPLQVTASFGIACSDEVNDDPQLLHEAADGAVYEAKRRGRNCVVISEMRSRQQQPSETA
ncbi:diguanylate cyclase [Roseateles asaccharophilus]|uniref:diguanylate cyclase n=1 Tax=Roseateles asaccharophilus TaxID=582607 RepID=A0ABU2A7E9_9BURK|nr:diguanylate cyclase [Roseateles asaccharophilus]MDR7333126.1 diguanylate cyclase (GGDEF)-like protein [Roseateles asaccharophilus]